MYADPLLAVDHVGGQGSPGREAQ